MRRYCCRSLAYCCTSKPCRGVAASSAQGRQRMMAREMSSRTDRLPAPSTCRLRCSMARLQLHSSPRLPNCSTRYLSRCSGTTQLKRCKAANIYSASAPWNAIRTAPEAWPVCILTLEYDLFRRAVIKLEALTAQGLRANRTMPGLYMPALSIRRVHATTQAAQLAAESRAG